MALGNEYTQVPQETASEAMVLCATLLSGNTIPVSRSERQSREDGQCEDGISTWLPLATEPLKKMYKQCLGTVY